MLDGPDARRFGALSGSPQIDFCQDVPVGLGIVAHIAFWVVLLIGAREMGLRRTGFFAVLWIVGYVGSAWITSGPVLFVSYVAVLDIVLILVVFKGDIRLQ